MLHAGRTIGSYRIVSKIGTGGMGAVYLAEHPVLTGKRVAMKVIHHDLATNGDVVKRFLQEAQAVNRIGHDHIIEIHDFGVTDDGDHFYIMEYLDGRTLAQLMAQEPLLEVARAKRIASQITAALAAAHAAGVIHRDLKPDNIMLTRRRGDDDFVKVLDFGLAKLFASESMVQTAHGVLLGTPQYMSPEACEGKRAVDHRTDIYAIGVLLYQMTTGQLPFDGDSMGEVLIKQVSTPPRSPRELNPTLSPVLEQVVLRCLAKVPELRYQSMNELRDAMNEPDEERTAVTAVPTASPLLVAAATGRGAIEVVEAAIAQKVAAVEAAVAQKEAARAVRVAAAAAANPPVGETPTKIEGEASELMTDREHGVTAPRAIATPIVDDTEERPPVLRTSGLVRPAASDAADHAATTTLLRSPLQTPTTVAIPPIVDRGEAGDGGDSATTLPDRPAEEAKVESTMTGVAVKLQARVASTQTSVAVPTDTDTPTSVAIMPTPASGKQAVVAAKPAVPVGTMAAVVAASRTSAPKLSRPPAKRAARRVRFGWPWVLVFGLVLGLGSGAIALVWFGDHRSEATASFDDVIDAGAAPVTPPVAIDAAVAAVAIDAAAPPAVVDAATEAELAIDSVPPGAAVFGPNNASLGITPLTMPWPLAEASVTFRFELAGYQTKLEDIVVNNATQIHVELEKESKTRPPKHRPKPRPRPPGSPAPAPAPAAPTSAPGTAPAPAPNP